MKWKPDADYRSVNKVKVKLAGKPKLVIDTMKFLSIKPLRIGLELIEHSQKINYVGNLVEETEDEIGDLELTLLTELLQNKRGKASPPQWMLNTLLRDNVKWRRLNKQRKKLQQLVRSLNERGRILQNQSGLIKNELFQGS